MAAEKQFENKVKKFLKEQGCYFVKYWGGGTFTKSGVPDILCCFKGYFIGIELKAPNGKPSPIQLHHLDEIDNAGGCAWLLYPDKFECFKEFIKQVKCASESYGKPKQKDYICKAVALYHKNKGW